MKWSWKIGEFAGIGVYMHATFLLLLGWVAFVHWQGGQNLAAVVSGLVFVLALFACVVAHEYGHALTARYYGIKTRDITLLPIGGVARLERMPDDPRQELWVALAGPAVNVVIAGVLFAWLFVTGGLVPVDQLAVERGSFFERLMMVNLFLAAFNMLPAFPMDGGRVLRAVLARRLEYTRATQVAANVGQGMAFLFGFAGLFGNPMLLFIALFVWIGAAQEATAVQMKSALGGIPVARAMLTDFRTLQPDDSLSRAAELILAGSQHDFPVLDGGRVAGVLTRADLIGALSAQNVRRPVAEVMRREFQVADSSDMLEGAMERLQACACHTLPVVHDGRLVGLVTMDNIGEFVMIHAALTGRQAPRMPLNAES
jgi:Zn-dependent protease/CBS domain-containing protein